MLDINEGIRFEECIKDLLKRTKMSITFYEDIPDRNCLVPIYNSWGETKRAIDSNIITINTYQMGLLNSELWEKGYRIYVVDENGRYEIKIGEDNERTSREIRFAHNLFKMWQNGEFNL